MNRVNRTVRHDLLRTVLLGLGTTVDPVDDANRRREAVGAAMGLLAYIEGLEVAVEVLERRLMHADALVHRQETPDV